MSARNYHIAEVKADLYNRITTDGEGMALMGDITKGDMQISLWQYDINSIATDDFANGVIKPTLQTGNGRWIRQPNYFFKRIEEYYGATDANGEYTVSYATAFGSEPFLSASIISTDPKEVVMKTASTASGFTIKVQVRADVLGLLPTYNNVASRNVKVLVVGV